MGKWGKWALLWVLAMAFAVPAWALDLKLSGKYEIQGRYYNEADIQSVATGRDTTAVTDMYLKHYFNLYPTIVVNDKLSVKADLEVFNNIISSGDSYGYYDKSSSVVRQGPNDADLAAGETKYLDQFSLFTVNELYVDATTPVGKFILGKTKQFSGIGWFIQTPAVPDWTFGLIYHKADEDKNRNSYLGMTDASHDGSDTLVDKTTHDNGDETHYIGIANYAKGPIDFKGTLAYKHTGAELTRTRIWYPFAYLNYALSKDITINSKFGFATGPLMQKDSPAAKIVTAALGAPLSTVYSDGLAKDLEVSTIGLWLGMGYKMDALKLQVDAMYMPGADAPNKVSAYSEDHEGLDTWLMNDVSDTNAIALQTPATIAALGDARVDGNFAFANVIMARLNLAYKINPKLDANLNLVWAQMENTKYLENWNTQYALGAIAVDSVRVLNWVDPDAMKFGGTGMLGGAIPAATQEFDVSADLGWEARVRMNYALMDNLSTGLDFCYYAPGDLYKDLIENKFVDSNTSPNRDLENQYAARWKMTVKF